MQITIFALISKSFPQKLSLLQLNEMQSLVPDGKDNKNNFLEAYLIHTCISLTQMATNDICWLSYNTHLPQPCIFQCLNSPCV